MKQSLAPNQAGTFQAFRIVLVGEVVIFFFAALLHTGLIGVPPLLAAMIVEGLCGIACVVSAYAVFTNRRWARKTAIIVQVFILAAVLLGIIALTRSPGLRTPLNVGLHAIMLALIVMGLALLAIPGTRGALNGHHT